jgi:hypothetical protein
MVDQLHRARLAAAQVSPCGRMASRASFLGDPLSLPPKNREPECARETTHRQNILSEERSVQLILIRLERAYRRVDFCRGSRPEEHRK